MSTILKKKCPWEVFIPMVITTVVDDKVDEKADDKADGSKICHFLNFVWEAFDSVEPLHGFNFL